MSKSPSPDPVARFPDPTDKVAMEKLEQTVAVKAYGKLKIRAIRSEDEQQMVRFHERISEESSVNLLEKRKKHLREAIRKIAKQIKTGQP